MSEKEAAKYPFLGQAITLVETLNLQIDDLADPSYAKALDRGAERVVEAILEGEVSARLEDQMVELISYPIAVMYVTILGEHFLDRRYALGEAVRAYRLLRGETEDRIKEIAASEFGWDLAQVQETHDDQEYRFRLRFSDYLRASSGFHEDKWKLVNRIMKNGYVLLTRNEAARLLQGEVEAKIEARLAKHARINLPEPLRQRLDRVSKVFEENRSRLGGESLPTTVVNEAFPPCMRICLEGLLSGRRASHMERFALTSFLVHVGMPLEKMVDLYVSVTDFDEAMTRYQIEHIAGVKGHRTRYTPPTCDTLRTHGICRGKDETCQRVKHPLAYYRIKARCLAQAKSPAKVEELNKAKQPKMDPS